MRKGIVCFLLFLVNYLYGQELTIQGENSRNK